MIHFVAIKNSVSAGGGGGSPGAATVSFSPVGGSYGGSSVNVTITVTNAAKLRWKINTGAYTTVSATSTVVPVGISAAGKTLSADALNSSDSVLASNSSFYDSSGGGGL